MVGVGANPAPANVGNVSTFATPTPVRDFWAFDSSEKAKIVRRVIVKASRQNFMVVHGVRCLGKFGNEQRWEAIPLPVCCRR